MLIFGSHDVYVLTNVPDAIFVSHDVHVFTNVPDAIFFQNGRLMVELKSEKLNG